MKSMLYFQQKENFMKKYLDLLKDVSLFENINSEDIPEMLHCLKAVKKDYPKDTFIRREGDTVDFIGIVLEGTIQILQDDYNGKRTITAAFGPGAMFAEAFACASISVFPINILAATDCVILLLNKKQIFHQHDSSCHFHDQLIENLLKIVARKNIFLNQKLGYISHKTTREKLLAFLNDQAKQHHSNEFTIPYARQALADYLGVERSAMSAEISKLQKDGVLETHRSYFRLLENQ
jgi:CRP-like cAMP-binding protein